MNQEYKCHDNFDICEDYLSKQCPESCPFVIRMERFARSLARVRVTPRCKTGLERFINKWGEDWRESKEVEYCDKTMQI